MTDDDPRILDDIYVSAWSYITCHYIINESYVKKMDDVISSIQVRISVCFFSTLIQIQESSVRYVLVTVHYSDTMYGRTVFYTFRHPNWVFYIPSTPGLPMAGMLKLHG